MSAPQLIHCSYHKCLTMFYARSMRAAVGRFGGYHHFNSDLAAFDSERSRYRVVSVNNHALRLDELGECRITRFVRDPRDLIVSGYFYHRRAAEPWCRITDPGDEDWTIVNGTVPSGLHAGESYAAFLQRVDQQEGLLAEIAFRARHFASMRRWSASDARVRVWRYEEILGNEQEVMAAVAEHYGLPRLLRSRVRRKAGELDAKRAAAIQDSHVRNPQAGQWRTVFTPRVEEAFMQQWGELLPLLGYKV